MGASPSSLVLLRSPADALATNPDGFRQDRDFLYFTGLRNAVGALLAVDTERRESWLFVPDIGTLGGFLSLMRPPFAYVDRDPDAATRLGIERVAATADF